MSEWSIERLKQLFYEESMIVPLDYKFDKQINSVIMFKRAHRVIYECIAPENHLLDAFKVFAIAEWQMKTFNPDKLISRADWGLGA